MSPLDVARELFPPGVPTILRWRLAMFLLSIVMLFHVAWACGWLLYLGLGNGFAKAEEVQSLKSDINALRTVALEQNMFDMHIKRCAAAPGSPIKIFLAEKIQTLQAEYVQVTGRYYVLPSCSEL